MKTRTKIGAILLSILLVLTFASCVTSSNVTFYTDVDGAEVYVDGVLIGTTPATAKLSNAIWDDPTITIKKEGYKPLNTGLQKEAKTVNIVLGVIVDWPAFLFCYGPKESQNFMLVPETNEKK